MVWKCKYNQIRNVRDEVCSLYPNKHNRAKLVCYPDNIAITDTTADVTLRDL